MYDFPKLEQRCNDAAQAVIDAEQAVADANDKAHAADTAFSKAAKAKRRRDAWLETVALADTYGGAEQAAKAAKDAVGVAENRVTNAKAAVEAAGKTYDEAAAETADLDFILATAINKLVSDAAMSPSDVAAGLPAAIEETRDEDVAMRLHRFGGKGYPLTRYDVANVKDWLASLQRRPGSLVSLFYSKAGDQYRASNAAQSALDNADNKRGVSGLKGEARDRRIEADYQEAAEWQS